VRYTKTADARIASQIIGDSDIVWLEWVGGLTAHLSRTAEALHNRPVICRVLGFEVFSPILDEVDWSVIDHLMFIAEHKRDLFFERYPDLARSIGHTVIHCGVDLDRWSIAPDKRDNGNLALIGNINYRKGLPMALQFLRELLDEDDHYHLYIRGAFQDARYKMAVETMAQELDLHQYVTFEANWIDDLNNWLQDKSHVMSFSLEESFHSTIGEGMAAGLKPVVHAWRGSRTLWPAPNIFTRRAEFLDIMRDRSFEPRQYRRYLIDHGLDAGRQLREIRELIQRLASQTKCSGVSRSGRVDVPACIQTHEARSPVIGRGMVGKVGFEDDIGDRKRHLLLLGMRRGGTTVLWRTLRQDRRLLCFFEPFRPEIRRHLVADRDDPRSTLTEFLAHRDLMLKHWSTVLPDDELIDGLLGHQQQYLRALASLQTNVHMKFVRCHAKIAAIRELIPDALIVLLVRDPRAFVTSQLKPYGRWLDPSLPDNLFEYRGWFDYWQYQTVCQHLGLEGFATRQLMLLWHHMTATAERQQPDLIIQFEHFATYPDQVMNALYDRLDLDTPDLDFSAIHTPRLAHRPDDPRWFDGLDESEVFERYLVGSPG
jgi:hypothetical protein